MTGQCDYLVSSPNVRRKRRWSHMVFSVTSPGRIAVSVVFLVGKETSGMMSAPGKVISEEGNDFGGEEKIKSY